MEGAQRNRFIILSSVYVKVRIRKGATHAAVLSVKAAANQSVA